MRSPLMVYVRHLCGTLSEHTGLYELQPNRAPNLETGNFTTWPHNQSWLHPSLFFPLTNSDLKGPPAGGLAFKNHHFMAEIQGSIRKIAFMCIHFATSEPLPHVKHT